MSLNCSINKKFIKGGKMRKFDFFEAILNEEYNDFKKNFMNKRDVQMVEFVNSKGDVVIPSKATPMILKKIENNFKHYFNSLSQDNYIDAGYLFNSISDKVKIIRNIEASKGLQFIFKTLIKRAEDPQFAGIIIARNDFVFHLTHPFNLYLLLQGKVKLPEKFDIFIFEFKNGAEMEKKVVEAAYDLHFAYLTLFINTKIENIEIEIKIKDEYTDFDQILFISNTESYIEIEKRISKNYETILFPLQILSKGELVPYVGWGGITKDIKALSLWGNGTGNLKAYHYSTAKNVCTGSKDNRTLDGWYTLSKINYNSTWFSDYLNEKFRELFMAGFMLARDILTGEYQKKIQSVQQSEE
jgi:hypothetical protein